MRGKSQTSFLSGYAVSQQYLVKLFFLHWMFLATAMDWMFICLQNSFVCEILTPVAMVLEGGASMMVMTVEPSWQWLSPLQKRSQGVCLTLLPCENIIHLWTRNQALTKYRISQDLDLGLFSLQTIRNKFLLLMSHMVSGILLKLLK